MEKLKATRKQYRRLFTKSCNEFESEESDLTNEEKLCKLKVIEEKAKLLLETETKIRDILFGEDTDETILAKEIDESELYFDKWRILENKLNSLFNSSVQHVTDTDASSSHNKLLHYPKIKLPTFDGNVKNWLGFWGQFQKIDKDASLDNHDKFSYLAQAMEKNTAADDLIKSFPPTGESYEKAIKLLQARFGNEELLIEIYVRDLLSLIIQKQSSSSLRKLYDQLEAKLRALETLGVAREKYGAILYPLVESALPDETLRVWERLRCSHRRLRGGEENSEMKLTPNESDLDRLLCFLRDEVESEERISLAAKGFNISNRAARTNKKENVNFKGKESSFSAADLIATSYEGQKTCIFCTNAFHNSWDCRKARNLSLPERQTIVEKAHCCFVCLRVGHSFKRCKVKSTCFICGKRHHILLCRNVPQAKMNEKIETEISTGHDETLANFSRSPNVILLTIRVIIKGQKIKRTARAIIDSGSQKSYILESTAKEMGYQYSKKEYLRHALFGGTSTKVCEHKVYTIFLSNLTESYSCNFDALSQTVICDSIPPISKGTWLKELKGYEIDLTDHEKGSIEILIGADIAGKLIIGCPKHMSSGLVAIQTKLGWTVMGKTTEEISNKSSTLTVTSMINKEACISDLWALDSLGITDPSEQKTKLEMHEATKQHFLNTVRLENNRFIVHLPWIEGHPPLPDNYDLALKRLHNTIKKLKAEHLFQEYENVFKEWLEEGVIEEVPTEELDFPCHYVPHRHVVKEHSTTKIRPVFDASAKQKGNPSLNECLEKGLNLIELIPTILTRFRLEKIGVISDIRKAFLQISLFSSDKNFLRFFWINNDNVLKHYRHCRVVFGVSSSPFLLGAVIQYHLQSLLDKIEGNSEYPSDVISKLIDSFYVDNCVTSVQNEAELQHFIEVSTSIMAIRKFELRGWEYTDPDLETDVVTNVLGMLWDKRSDMLQVNITGLRNICFEKVTKRSILAIAHKIFDPTGVTCPVFLFPKILLQRTWELKLSWDEEVNIEIKSEFLKWIRDIYCLENIQIPRWLKTDGNEDYSIHIFCDASRLAYAAAAFIRVEGSNTVKVQLLQARSRVSPCGRKETTIARLELLAATIASRLSSTVLKDFMKEKVFFWTDSTTVLAWIRRDESWGTFVQNRVQEIRLLTHKEDWRHVPGSLNPADLPSRGCSARHLSKSKWWEGPSWLLKSPENWPNAEFTVDEEEVAVEKKRKIVSSLISFEMLSSICTRFSSYVKTVRLVGWILRFAFNCKNKLKKIGELAVEELDIAENYIIRLIQLESFQGLDDKRLQTLSPFYDDGVLRIKTGVFQRDDTTEFRTPVILPGEHPIVKSLIIEEHRKKGHAGVSYILNSLRERFWIICGRRIVRSILRTCVICKRHSAKCVSPPSTAPPLDRVKDAAVFEVTGVDFAGPVMLKSKEKAWICLFTCAVYRAVHLELVTSLTTEAFLQAFHRFVSRRGKPTTIYSDNGTNFLGTSNALKSINFEEIGRRGAEERITWKFIPPGAPWWGGWWERLIGITNQVLKRILRRACLNYERLTY